MIETTLFRQENTVVQLVSLIIQLNLVVGNQPIEAYGMYPGMFYAMLALLSGLNVLAKFASQPRSLASGRLVLGVKHLILNVERIRGSALKPYMYNHSRH